MAHHQQPDSGSNVYQIRDGPKGRGLFANQTISPRTLIHEAPCIRVVKDEYEKFMKFTILEHYLFNANGGDKLLALGHGSLFNHSRHPNVDYRIDSIYDCIRYFSGHKTIEVNEELCINYGGNLWFDDASTGSSRGNCSSDDSSEPDHIEGVATFLSKMDL